MTLSAIFIQRPVATVLLVIGILLLGVLGYRLLPVAALPSVDFPTIEVAAQLPGAGPEIIASSVTAPLEHQLGQISGLTAMSSTSSLGIGRITLQFSLAHDIDAAAQDVQAAINGASGLLPLKLMPNPPTYSKVNPADTPILVLALTSEAQPPRVVADYADTVIAQKLSQIDGVGLVTVEGSQKRAIRLQANPTALAALDLTLADIRTAVTAATADLPKGSLDGPRQALQVSADDQLFDAEGFRDTVIAYHDGAAVRLGDVAHAVDSVEDDRLAAWYDGKPAVILDIQRQPGANVVALVAAIRRQLPMLRAAIPPSIDIDVLTDRTETIRASVADVQATLALTVALVVLVIFVFLREFWATLIPSVTLPVSLIATFAVMALARFSLDNLSLMALTVASGFVVDDAIVMIENIMRFIEAGETPIQAALKGARQIGFTIVSLTVSLVAVFIPLLLMGGVIGRLFREFAVTLSAAVIVSSIVSLTLTPMMCARLLRPKDPARPKPALFGWSERGFDRLRDGYDTGLRWVLRHRRLVLGLTLLMVAGAGWLYVAVPKGFLPQQDTGLVIGVFDAAPDISFAAMAAKEQRVAAIMLRDPDVAAVSAVVGTGTVNTTGNSGRLFISLKPHDERSAGADRVMLRLKGATAGIEGLALHLQSAQDIQIDTRLSRTQYQYTLQDANAAELAAWAPRLRDAMSRQPELADVTSDQQPGGLQARLRIDRDAASRLGVSVQAIDDALYDAFGQRQIATIFTQQNQYRVVLEADPAFRDGPDSFGHLRVKAASGAIVPLAAVTDLEPQAAPLLVTHQGLFPATTLSFNLSDGVSLGAALDAIRRAERAIGLPQGIATGFSGSAAEFRTSLDSELGLILGAIVTVYIVLGVLYESYIHPITILSALPPAGIGALLALIAAGYELNVISLIAIILLIGIVKKNAIMMVDFAIDAVRGGLAPEQAIHQACLLRFRPIMMTTMAALLGALPLALGTGAGAELRRPLGIAIVGGLIASQFLTLYTVPVTYLAFERLRGAVTRRRRTNAPEASATNIHALPAPRRRVAD
jgi:hydrophobe/amphiphile efflux-1 (HAE1) family protein